MTEQWVKWEPITDLFKKYFIDSISSSIEGFIVDLSGDSAEMKRVRVTFENSVAAHRDTNESFRLKLIEDLGEYYGDDFYGEWTFFKVTNSSYIQWLSEQASGIFDPSMFMHFSLIASDSILDIVASYEPRVELIG